MTSPQERRDNPEIPAGKKNEEGWKATLALRAITPQVKTLKDLNILNIIEGVIKGFCLVEAIEALEQEVSNGRTSGQTSDKYMSEARLSVAYCEACFGDKHFSTLLLGGGFWWKLGTTLDHISSVRIFAVLPIYLAGPEVSLSFSNLFVQSTNSHRAPITR